MLPFDFRNFAQTVDGYLTEIAKLNGASALHLESVRKELRLLKRSADACESSYRRWLDKASAAPASALASANELLYRTERSMVLPAGLPGATG